MAPVSILLTTSKNQASYIWMVRKNVFFSHLVAYFVVCACVSYKSSRLYFSLGIGLLTFLQIFFRFVLSCTYSTLSYLLSMWNWHYCHLWDGSFVAGTNSSKKHNPQLWPRVLKIPDMKKVELQQASICRLSCQAEKQSKLPGRYVYIFAKIMINVGLYYT